MGDSVYAQTSKARQECRDGRRGIAQLVGISGKPPMRNVVSAVATWCLCLAAVLPIAAQAPATAPSGYRGPRTADGKPNLNGIWQALGTAHWNLEAHTADENVPAGQSVVEGGDIPYQPSALAQRRENFEKRLTDDPLVLCHLPGVPRATYLPFPFQIVQTPKHVTMLYEYASATRIIYTDGSPHPAPARSVDGRFARSLGGRYLGRGRHAARRQDVVRHGREFP